MYHVEHPMLGRVAYFSHAARILSVRSIVHVTVKSLKKHGNARRRRYRVRTNSLGNLPHGYVGQLYCKLYCCRVVLYWVGRRTRSISGLNINSGIRADVLGRSQDSCINSGIRAECSNGMYRPNELGKSHRVARRRACTVAQTQEQRASAARESASVREAAGAQAPTGSSYPADMSGGGRGSRRYVQVSVVGAHRNDGVW